MGKRTEIWAEEGEKGNPTERELAHICSSPSPQSWLFLACRGPYLTPGTPIAPLVSLFLDPAPPNWSVP